MVELVGEGLSCWLLGVSVAVFGSRMRVLMLLVRAFVTCRFLLLEDDRSAFLLSSIAIVVKRKVQRIE
jgi:hypothetical protein